MMTDDLSATTTTVLTKSSASNGKMDFKITGWKNTRLRKRRFDLHAFLNIEFNIDYAKNKKSLRVIKTVQDSVVL